MRLKSPSWWYGERIPLAAWALWPVSAAYGAIVERRFRTAAPYASSLPVVCVGNFTMGGAGKTPVALKLASMLREAGLNPGFLTRGYGGSERGPHVIDAEDTADQVGDEPLLLARCATTVVSRDRPAGARLLETLSNVRRFGQQFETPHPSPLPLGEGVPSRPLPLRPLSPWERGKSRQRHCRGVPSP